MKGGKRLSEEERERVREALDSCTDWDAKTAAKATLERDDEPEYCTWTRDGGWLRSPHGRMVAKAYGQEPVPPKFCEDCGKPVKGE